MVTILIKTDPISRAFIILDYLITLIVFLIAANYGNIPLAITTLGILVILIAGQNIVRTSGADIEQIKRVSIRFVFSSVYLIGGAIIAFLIIDVSTPKLFQLPRFFPPVLSSLPSNSSAIIGALLLTQIAISEEVLIRQGVVNLFAKSPLVAIVASAIGFGIYHIPVYGGNEVTFVEIAFAGAALALIDIVNKGELYTSMVTHQINNILSLGYSLSTTGSVLLMIPHPALLPVAALGLVLIVRRGKMLNLSRMWMKP